METVPVKRWLLVPYPVKAMSAVPVQPEAGTKDTLSK
ncbi:hypothetical protein SDC9_130309 [bioreactor metagenome]|uniref:Uncharacterized protein n=1 Tax=bioreactor metagenome TaxID=1076179 RepID=A0A645D1F7_9ZZZZ